MFEFRALENADVVVNPLWDKYTNNLKVKAKKLKKTKNVLLFQATPMLGAQLLTSVAFCVECEGMRW